MEPTRINEDLISKYLAAKEARLEADRSAKKLKEDEDKILAAITQSVVSGGYHPRVSKSQKTKYVADDWAKVWEYIQNNQAWELVHKRLTESALAERLADGEKVPGIEYSEITVITVK